MNPSQRLEADAWYTALRRWRLLHRSISLGRVPGAGPNIRMVAGAYAQATNAPTRRLESLVLLPVGALPTSQVVEAIRRLPPEARLVVDEIRMAPVTGRNALPGRLLRRQGVAYTGPRKLWTGYAAACLILAEELRSGS